MGLFCRARLREERVLFGQSQDAVVVFDYITAFRHKRDLLEHLVGLLLRRILLYELGEHLGFRATAVFGDVADNPAKG